MIDLDRYHDARINGVWDELDDQRARINRLGLALWLGMAIHGGLVLHLLDGVVFAVAGFGLLAISAAGTVATLLDMLLLAQERTMAMKEDEG